MLISGIIAEYNPFHNGHLNQLETLKNELKPDYIVIALSQDFLQRGIPSNFDKYFRTQLALEYGADLVIGLPYLISNAAAPDFASGAISLLNLVGINYLSFGIEDNIFSLETLAKFLVNEPSSFKKELKKYLTEGFSYPKAQSLALNKFFSPSDLSLINKPNNILGLEYLKTIYKNNLPINIFPIKREDNYHNKKLNTYFPSALALRKALSKKNYQNLNKFIPYEVNRLIKEFKPINTELIFSLAKLQLINKTKEELHRIHEFDSSLVDKFQNSLQNSFTYNQFISNLKTKNITRMRINRLISNLILNVTKTMNEELRPTYLRVLGFNEKGKELLKGKKSITNLNKSINLLENKQKQAINLDLKAANLRSQLIGEEKFNFDLKQKPIIL